MATKDELVLVEVRSKTRIQIGETTKSIFAGTTYLPRNEAEAVVRSGNGTIVTEPESPRAELVKTTNASAKPAQENK